MTPFAFDFALPAATVRFSAVAKGCPTEYMIPDMGT